MPPSRRTPKILAAVAVAAACLAAGAWRLSVTRSPAYALRELGAAIRTRDTLAVRRRLDSRSLGEQVAADLTRGMLRDIGKEALGGDASAGSALGLAAGTKMTEAIQPALAEMLVDAIDSMSVGVEPVRRDPSRPAASVADLRRGADTLPILLSLTRAQGRTITGLGATTEFGDSAVVELVVREADVDTTLTAQVALRRVGGAWRVVGLPNVSKYLERKKAVESLRLEAINRPIRARLAQLVGLGPVRSTHEEIGYFSEWLTTRVPVTNRGTSPIRSAVLQLSGPELTDRHVYLFTATSDRATRVAPGETVTATHLVSYNQFIPLHRSLRFAPEAYTASAYAVVLGTAERPDTVRAFDSWAEYRERHPYRPPADDSASATPSKA